MPNEAMIEKIKGLLALATGSGGTESERESAMRFARKLMAKYCVKESELASADSPLEVISEDFQPSRLYPISSALVKWLPAIASPICESLGGFCTFSMKTGKVTLWGYAPTIIILQYTLNVVLKHGSDDYKKAYVVNRTMSIGESFWSGFSESIQEKFKINPVDATDINALTIYDPVRAKHNSFMKVVLPDFGSQNLRNYGKVSGASVTVHKGMEGASSKGNLLK